jgi:hypothetical protein
MTVLDPIQRYLRLDEKDNSPTIKVAKGVSFIATANIGMEYTATRVIDRAILDRFSLIEMSALSEDDEYTLLKGKFPTIDENQLLQLCSIVGDIRKEINTDSPRLSTMISTRNTIEIAELIMDGFSIMDAAELLIYPLYPNDGNDSERVYVKQLIQKYVGKGSKKQLFDIERLIQKHLERELVEDFWPSHDVPNSPELRPNKDKRPKKPKSHNNSSHNKHEGRKDEKTRSRKPKRRVFSAKNSNRKPKPKAQS